MSNTCVQCRSEPHDSARPLSRSPGFTRLLTAACGTLTLTACGPSDAGSTAARGFTSQDEVAVRALEEAYRSGWLANDSAAVMGVLTPDVVLMPAGSVPIIGDSAARTYWWPDDGSRTTINAYEIVIDEVKGSGDLAYLRGSGTIDFTYATPEGTASDLTSEAVHLSIARRGADGEWRIARRVWSRIR